QAAFLDGDVGELQGGESVADPPPGVAILDDCVAGELGGGGDLQVNLDRVRLDGDEAFAGDGEALNILSRGNAEGPLHELGTGQTRAGNHGQDEDDDSDARLSHCEVLSLAAAVRSPAGEGAPVPRRG